MATEKVEKGRNRCLLSYIPSNIYLQTLLNMFSPPTPPRHQTQLSYLYISPKDNSEVFRCLLLPVNCAHILSPYAYDYGKYNLNYDVYERMENVKRRICHITMLLR